MDGFNDRIDVWLHSELSRRLARAEPRSALIALMNHLFFKGVCITRAEEDEIERLTTAMNVAFVRGLFRVRTTTPIQMGFLFLLMAAVILLFSFQGVRGDESQLRSVVFAAGGALPLTALVCVVPAARAGWAGTLGLRTTLRTIRWLRRVGASCFAYTLIALATLLMTTAEQAGTSNLPAMPAFMLGVTGGCCYGLARYLHRIRGAAGDEESR